MELPVIEKEALQLPKMERAFLADRLLASLSDVSGDVRASWIEESESRIAAYQRGDIQAEEGKATMQALRH